MAQSLNHTVDLATTGVFYMGMGNKVGKYMVGDKALEFYNDNNPEDNIQIPWTSVEKIGANVSGRKISRHFQVFTKQGKFLFASKESGKILKVAREKIGNDKIVRLPTLGQKIWGEITSRFNKK
ncbi:DUF956 family protein [Streptococcus tangpeifui]|uniref:DUF956 family protein n=1 Tax=Streptococcus tangpeifui TaxID=2709400 RepID=UPI0013EB9A76|nr:DUF956 family protein [Streptococcus sp. ZJ373]